MCLQRAHAQFSSQGQGLLVVGFGRRDLEGIGVGLDDAKLVQRERLVPTCLLLSGQVERLARVLPGLPATSRQTTDLAEPCDPLRICRPPVRIASLIPSSSSMRPSSTRPWSAEA